MDNAWHPHQSAGIVTSRIVDLSARLHSRDDRGHRNELVTICLQFLLFSPRHFLSLMRLIELA